MKLYAVETADKGKLCQINARNILIYEELHFAKERAVTLALCNHRGKVRSSNDISIAEPLDKISVIFDSSEGTAETAEALAYITEIETH